MLTIKEILNDIDVVSLSGEQNPLISDIEFDSRKVKESSLFIAVKGYKSDGHDFIADAVAAGATAVICQTLPEVQDKRICWVRTTDSARALGYAASARP